MDNKTSKIEKFGLSFGYVLMFFGLIVFGKDLINWGRNLPNRLHHPAPSQLIVMEGLVVDIDHNANTFVIIQNGESHQYHVDGGMPLGNGINVIISYRPSFHWYRLIWQDKDEIEIASVSQVGSPTVDNDTDIDNQIIKALNNSQRQDDKSSQADGTSLQKEKK